MKSIKNYITEKLKISKNKKLDNTFYSFLLKLSEITSFKLDITSEKSIHDFTKYLVYENIIIELQDEESKIDYLTYPNTDFFDIDELGKFFNELLENDANYDITKMSNNWIWLHLYVDNEIVYSLKIFDENNKISK